MLRNMQEIWLLYLENIFRLMERSFFNWNYYNEYFLNSKSDPFYCWFLFIYFYLVNRVLNRPEIWMRSIDWSFGSLGPRPPPSKNISRSSVVGYFFQGTPDEVESDRCIVQLAEDVENRVCQVSDHCADMLLKNDSPRGYPLTHRLLYVQTAIVVSKYSFSKFVYST